MLSQADTGDVILFNVSHTSRCFGRKRLIALYCQQDPFRHSSFIKVHPYSPVTLAIWRGGVRAASVF